jgi:hypothetical protein
MSNTTTRWPLELLTGDVALRPTGNTQGGYYLYSLSTGRRLNRNHCTPLPMPAEVIERVHQLTNQRSASSGLSFADRTGIDPHAGDDADDVDWDPTIDGDDDDNDVPLIADDIAGVDEDGSDGESEGDDDYETESENDDENENDENFMNDNEDFVIESETENQTENENENLQNENGRRGPD